jgi:hypothetical protein
MSTTARMVPAYSSSSSFIFFPSSSVSQYKCSYLSKNVSSVQLLAKFVFNNSPSSLFDDSEAAGKQANRQTGKQANRQTTKIEYFSQALIYMQIVTQNN